jgi:hypothetical protein
MQVTGTGMGKGYEDGDKDCHPCGYEDEYEYFFHTTGMRMKTIIPYLYPTHCHPYYIGCIQIPFYLFGK